MTMHKVGVPAQVMNGTLPYVILDCDYSLDVSEKRTGGGMVLKWYWNGRNIYQWIPPAHPRVRLMLQPTRPFRTVWGISHSHPCIATWVHYVCTVRNTGFTGTNET